MTPKPIDVIVLGLSPTGLYAVREAGQAGYNVLGVGTPSAPGLWSRYLSERISAASAHDRVAAIINRFPADATRKPVLIVTSDQDLEVVMDQRDALSARVHMQGAYVDGLAGQIMDKDTFYRLCDAHGVNYPTLWAAPVLDAADYRDKISYPCMVKPARIQDVKHLMAGQKGWILENPDDFDRVIPTIPAEAGTLLMQEIVPGPESEITLWCGYIDAAGVVRQRFTARKLRQYPPGFGSASLVQSEADTRTAEIAENLLTTLGYHGIAAAEFKRHPDTGELKIIEVNPRPSLWFSVTTAAGVRLIETAVADLTRQEGPRDTMQTNGVRWRYLIKDTASKLFYSRSRSFVLPAPDVTRSGPATQHADVVASWRDPAPAFAEIWMFVRKIVARSVQKLGIGK